MVNNAMMQETPRVDSSEHKVLFVNVTSVRSARSRGPTLIISVFVSQNCCTLTS